MAERTHSAEEWRDIPGYEGLYQASSDGRIRSLGRTSESRDRLGRRRCQTYPSKVLAQSSVGIGYKVCCLTANGKSGNAYVHRLVCGAFHGACPSDKRDAAHGDGDVANNVPINLRWATSAENQSDKVIHGRSLRGERHHKARLTEDNIREIRRRAAVGEANNTIGDDFNCTAGMIRSIILRRTWRHIE